MARPSDWSAVDLPMDPVPGNPGTIRQSAANARSIERNIEEQVNRLNRLKDGKGWDSESGKTFSSSAGDLAGAIEKAKGRYTALAAALDEWADGLEDIQRQADAALVDAEAAKQAHSTAANQTITGDPGTPDHQDQLDAQTRAMGSAQDDLDAAKRTVARLGGIGEAGEYGQLADRIAGKIKAGADDGLKDHWYDHVKQWIHDARGVLNVIKDVLDAVSTVLLVITVIAAVFFPVALPVLAIIGLALAGAHLLVTSAQAFAGDATMGDVGKDVLGLALSAVGLGAAKYAEAAMPLLRAGVGEVRAAASARAVVQSGGGAGAELSAFLRGADEGVQAARAAGSAKSTVALDTAVTGGLVEIAKIVQLAPESRLVQEAAIKASAGAGVQAGLNVKGLYDQFKDPNDLISVPFNGWGPYWESKTAVHVGSL